MRTGVPPIACQYRPNSKFVGSRQDESGHGGQNRGHLRYELPPPAARSGPSGDPGEKETKYLLSNPKRPCALERELKETRHQYKIRVSPTLLVILCSSV